MNNYGEFFLKFMDPLVGSIWGLIKAIGSSLFKMFNILNYIDVIKEYKNDLSGTGILLIILGIICILALFGLVIFLIYKGIRRFIKYRHNVTHQEDLVEEIDSLNNEVIKLKNENQKLMEMADPENGDVEYDENGNIINKLSTGESRFFKLSKVDQDYANYEPPVFEENITLDKLCEQFRNYASNKLGLYYTIDLIRLFISAFASNRLIILQGISGTGKTSLAYAFGYFVKNESVISSVQPSWRDSTELFGYFNEFTKRFNESEFLAKMYEAKYKKNIYISVLDEMNIARVEYYFAEMLSILELPSQKEWIISLVPNAWDTDPKLLNEGKFNIPNNMWYIGTINNDDSTFMITDKVYDRALPINIDTQGVAFDAPETEALDITADYFTSLFKKAKENRPISDEMLKKIKLMDEYVIKHFRLTFGNRIMKQIKDFVPAYIACGGEEVVAVDYLVANKILRKFEQLNLAYIRNEIDGFVEFLNQTFGENKMVECIAFLDRLKKSI